jgi:tetratricopeptide (TPR) repeat protein
MKTKNLTRIAVMIAFVGTIIGLSVTGCKDSETDKEYYDRGVANLEKGEQEAAVSDLTKVIELRPGFAMAHFHRGRAYIHSSEPDKAILDLDRALEIGPAFAVAHTERALAYYMKKEYDKAWEDVHKAESLGQEIREGFRGALQRASGRMK